MRIEHSLVQLIDLAERQGIELDAIPQIISISAQDTLNEIQPSLTRQQVDLPTIPLIASESSRTTDDSIEESLAESVQRLLSMLQADSDTISELKEEISSLRENTAFLMENTPTEIDTRITAAIANLRSDLSSKF